MSSSKFYAYENLKCLHEHSINLDTREIYLGGTSNDGDGEINHSVATQFIKNLHLLDKTNNNIVIHISSIGGDVDSGYSIYDAILNARSHVTVIAHGLVASMASIIFQAGDLRVMMGHSTLMIHFGSSTFDDNNLAISGYAELIKKNNKKFVEIYTDKCKEGEHFKEKTNSYIKRWIDRKLKDTQDWWLSPEECVQYGLADGIFGTKGFLHSNIFGV